MDARRTTFALLGLAALAIADQAAAFSAASTAPQRNAVAPTGTTVAIIFELPVDPASVHAGTFRVFGRCSGAKTGAYVFSGANTIVTFVPSTPFAAGETVSVHLSHNILAGNGTPFRSEGFSFQFLTATVPTVMGLVEIDRMSNRIDNVQTRIYGACATDLNADGFPDLTTVNEVSGDVRVFLNRADGTGLFHDFLDPQDIGQYASPNEPADFDLDGKTDLCIAATGNDSVWVLLGDGDGTFGDITPYAANSGLHGVATLDVDGDADMDIVASNLGGNDCSLLINDGNGVFAPAPDFDGGVNGEDGLAAADMDGDGITDILVAGRWSETILIHRGNGDGTFTAVGPAQDSGGETWVLAVGDLNGDGDLDVTAANNFSNNGAVLLGNGDCTLSPPLEMPTGARITSTDLGDLDGDGDLDWVLSSFGGGWWRIYTNDGDGSFTDLRQIEAPANPSCAVLYDGDSDGDLDMCLTDEIADLAILMENTNDPTSAGPPSSGPSRLLENRPNPFAGRTTIRFQLAEPGEVTLELFDVRGRQVAAHRLGALPAGLQEVPIEAVDRAGSRLPPGPYFYRIIAPGWSAARSMILFR